ncbi:hypothetical protein [Nocardioides sp.]|uniref:hypothetical protein n=1 Tax=Nocardioides sp. TaxID=35761 RepID=UPI0035178BA5
MSSPALRHRLSVPAAACAAVLALAGCGEDAATEGAGASSSSVPRTSPSPTQSSSPSESQQIGSGDEICAAFQGLADVIGPIEKPADLTETQFEQYREALTTLRAVDLPAGVDADVVEGRRLYIDAFLALDLEQTRAMDAGATAPGLSDAEAIKATGFLSYLTQTCPGVVPQG